VHSLGEYLEEAVKDSVPLLRIELLGQIHRPLHVGEEDGHLFALAFEGAAGGEDLLGEVVRGVGPRIALRRFLRGAGQLLPAFTAKSLARLIAGAAPGTGESQRCAAPGTEFPALPIIVSAG
jgi:hypothetical protein